MSRKKHSRLIQVFEHERIYTDPKKDLFRRSITSDELKKLYQFNDRNNNKYFTGIRDGVKFQQYVGVIQIGGLTIEILPKTDKKRFGDKHEYQEASNKWRIALLRMLSLTRQIKLDSVSQANLKRRSHSLLDLYFELFLTEVEHLQRKGLVKKYHETSANLNALKGRLDFSMHLNKNLVHRERFYTHHQTYDANHIINQILLQGILKLLQVASASFTDRIMRVLMGFPEMEPIQVAPYHFEKIKFNRKTESYREALKIAKMILFEFSPDIQSGQENMLALLFDMNKLWEEYVYRMLLRVKDSNWKVSFQNSMQFWARKTIRPDLVIHNRSTNEKYIIDTKWKVINANKPSDDDLKQMYAYNMYWKVGRSMLLYPSTRMVNEKFGKFWQGREGVNECKLGFINVIKEDGTLDFGIGNRIMEKLENYS